LKCQEEEHQLSIKKRQNREDEANENESRMKRTQTIHGDFQ
jgi:hypothetical protein